MGRTHAPPHLQVPAACTGRRQRSWCWRRSGSPATEPSGPVTKLDPLDHTSSTSSCPLDPRGAGWGEISPPGLPVRAAARVGLGFRCSKCTGGGPSVFLAAPQRPLLRPKSPLGSKTKDQRPKTTAGPRWCVVCTAGAGRCLKQLVAVRRACGCGTLWALSRI
jgi:hypothetical protein